MAQGVVKTGGRSRAARGTLVRVAVTVAAVLALAAGWALMLWLFYGSWSAPV